MNQERRSVESPQTNAIPLPAISLPVAERQGYHQLTTTPRGFQPTEGDDARIVRRGATRECVETTTHIHWATDRVERIQSSLRDEMVWRDG